MLIRNLDQGYDGQVRNQCSGSVAWDCGVTFMNNYLNKGNFFPKHHLAQVKTKIGDELDCTMYMGVLQANHKVLNNYLCTYDLYSPVHTDSQRSGVIFGKCSESPSSVAVFSTPDWRIELALVLG